MLNVSATMGGSGLASGRLSTETQIISWWTEGETNVPRPHASHRSSCNQNHI